MSNTASGHPWRLRIGPRSILLPCSSHFHESETGQPRSDWLRGDLTPLTSAQFPPVFSCPHAYTKCVSLTRRALSLPPSVDGESVEKPSTTELTFSSRMGPMSSVWRSLAPAAPSEAKKLLERIQAALYEAFQRHQRDGDGARALSADDIAPIRELCDQLLPVHFELTVPEPAGEAKPETQQRPGRNRVRYQHIWENELFSMGIFILPPGASIPLHDHPEMSVISRVLYGKLHVTSCDLAPPKEAEHLFRQDPSGSSPMSPASSDSSPARRIARIFQEAVITAPHTTALLPHEGNLHEFIADEELGCAIFDILTPPYEPEDGRDCTYYRITSEKRSDGEGATYVQLEEFEPSNFDVVSEPYRGPRLSFPVLS